VNILCRQGYDCRELTIREDRLAWLPQSGAGFGVASHPPGASPRKYIVINHSDPHATMTQHLLDIVEFMLVIGVTHLGEWGANNHLGWILAIAEWRQILEKKRGKALWASMRENRE
jgi:hypothetical protein